MEFRGEDAPDSDAGVLVCPSARSMLDGVGSVRGTFLWIAAERSSKVAMGVVRGRR
jgi:hypothetical protein